MLSKKSILCFLLGVPFNDISTALPFTVFLGDICCDLGMLIGLLNREFRLSKTRI